MSNTVYDYGIVGAGAAGLQLALAFAKDSYFDNKQILIIDKEEKNRNDKTWCFWEKGAGQWDSIIDFQWNQGKFISTTKELDLQLSPYAYKKLPSIAFYNYAKKVLASKNNITFSIHDVSDIKEQANIVNIITPNVSFSIRHCFDSRINEALFNKKDQYIRVLQPFKGWEINFDAAVFDPSSFTMMDFRLRHQDSTSFVYVLPTSPQKALVEFTLFTKKTISDQQFDGYLDQYIKKYISTAPYQIKAIEQGVIPMSNFPFHKSSTSRITKIGTAGSWVRPSTGYSFKYTEKYVRQIVDNLKANKPPNANLLSTKSFLYDTLLLDILSEKNHLGAGMFELMYTKNHIHQIFKFLDGETTLWEDIQICFSMRSYPFFPAIAHQIRKRLISQDL